MWSMYECTPKLIVSIGVLIGINNVIVRISITSSRNFGVTISKDIDISIAINFVIVISS